VSKLYYDATCPVCQTFINLIKQKVTSTSLEIVPLTDPNAKDFKYSDSTGKITTGDQAIDAFTEEYPEVLSYFWMLPQRYQKTAVKVAKKIGSVVRSMVKNDCGCKK